MEATNWQLVSKYTAHIRSGKILILYSSILNIVLVLIRYGICLNYKCICHNWILYLYKIDISFVSTVYCTRRYSPLQPRPIWPSANHFNGLHQRPLVMGDQIPKGPRNTKRSNRYQKVQEVPKGLRGTLRSKRYLKVQEVTNCPRDTKMSKRYQKVQEVPKGPKGT